MSNPVNIEKDLNTWTFDDLCKWASWEVVQSLYSGSTLKSTMWGILQVATQWKPPKEIK
jgi:hypothetical protein